MLPANKKTISHTPYKKFYCLLEHRGSFASASQHDTINDGVENRCQVGSIRSYVGPPLNGHKMEKTMDSDLNTYGRE